MPPLTMAYLVVCVCMYLACMISCLAMNGGMFCHVFELMALVPERVFLHGEVWRLLTCHMAPYSLWSMLCFTLYIVFICYGIEKRLGTARMAVLMGSCMLSISLVACAFAAFFGLVPGISGWSYLANWWHDTSNTGQSALLMALTIIVTRGTGMRRATCCCFEMPLWLFYICLFAFCQLMMYPCWYGLEYNAGGLVIGLLFPVQRLPDVRGGLGAIEGSSQQAGATQGKGYYEFSPPEAEQARPAAKKGGFSGQSRTL